MRFLILLLAASANYTAAETLPDSALPGRAVSGGASVNRVSRDAVWPSLAKRPAESAASGRMLNPATAGAGAGPALPGDAVARLATATRDVDQLEQRWRTQLAKQQITAAGHQHAMVEAAAEAEAEAAAQLEAGRRDKLAGQVADARTQIEAITGDLAIAAAAGIDVNGPLRTAGTLLSRCAKLTMASAVANDTVGAGAEKSQ